MNSIAAVIFFAALAAANAGWVSPLALSAIPTGYVIQGPSSRSTVVGPDGSSISSVAPGGTIIADQNSAFVSQGAPAAVISPPARHVVASAVGVRALRSIAAENTVVAGPSGTISQSRGTNAAPAITSYSGFSPLWAQQAVGVPAPAENTVVAGPSGTISRSRGINGAETVALW